MITFTRIQLISIQIIQVHFVVCRHSLVYSTNGLMSLIYWLLVRKCCSSCRNILLDHRIPTVYTTCPLYSNTPVSALERILISSSSSRGDTTMCRMEVTLGPELGTCVLVCSTYLFMLVSGHGCYGLPWSRKWHTCCSIPKISPEASVCSW